ncbi:hypothetical protein SAMN05660337_2924 [Maridesulfovibrio ferrireducens]|uniref:Uncharacterized protein n=1 Tax=Maridesulfovibrio ferrireducens TaxID=246191 RepID=A0A1G9JRK6_9BACT|nr:TRAP transporter TatT component family protein [Maridesulfovibrio ferrireducens]SDL40177.1 hypothetical protein SAMN05660337_2924 [Maridesulfovibrio ferrireducens]
MILSLRIVMIAVLGCFLCSCAAQTGTTAAVPTVEYKTKDVSLWKSCTLKQAESLAASSKDADNLESATCYAWLLESGTVTKTDDAIAGRKVIEAYLKKNPKSGVGHYLSAFLAGKEAQLSPLRGLDLVPVLEQEALLAEKLSPEVDFGGPDRMLGELYLEAPSPPLSVGNLSKSLVHFEKAVKISPDFYLNHLGYGAALLEDGEKAKACVQFSQALKSKSFDKKSLKINTYEKLVGACQKAPAAKK